mgnify:CR=1 FL=1
MMTTTEEHKEIWEFLTEVPDPETNPKSTVLNVTELALIENEIPVPATKFL